MHISMMPGSKVQYSYKFAAGGPAAPPETPRTFQAEQNSAANGRISEIKASYDVTNISPREIDQMFDKLVDAGHPIDGDMLMLSSRGEKFLSHVATIVGHAIDPLARSNLVESNRSNMEFARLNGDDLAGYMSFGRFLSSFGSNHETLLPGHNPRTSQVDSIWAMRTQE